MAGSARSSLKYFVINGKNYPEISGPRIDAFLKAIEDVASQFRDVEFYVAPPNFGLAYCAKTTEKVHVLAQHVDAKEEGASTGFSIPEIAKSFGAAGSIVNHSEHRISPSEIELLVARLRSLGILSVVCAKDDEEVGRFAKLNPDFIAVEPPDLIGSGKAVSKEKPEIVMNSRKALEQNRASGSRTKLLCGAGIVERIDTFRAVELGAEGILVASGVVKARDWKTKITELARGLSDARTQKANSQEKL